MWASQPLEFASPPEVKALRSPRVLLLCSGYLVEISNTGTAYFAVKRRRYERLIKCMQGQIYECHIKKRLSRNDWEYS
uniref:Uncharacterized protein n=1 Tax=Echinococcus canadensis TaxID=519352 RepID=A0A915EX79_9CEST